jgi:hypothetical protein
MRIKYYRSSGQYRERAEECRVVAQILAAVELREQMLKFAADYERLAETADNETHHEPVLSSFR